MSQKSGRQLPHSHWNGHNRPWQRGNPSNVSDRPHTRQSRYTGSSARITEQQPTTPTPNIEEQFLHAENQIPNVRRGTWRIVPDARVALARTQEALTYWARSASLRVPKFRGFFGHITILRGSDPRNPGKILPGRINPNLSPQERWQLTQKERPQDPRTITWKKFTKRFEQRKPTYTATIAKELLRDPDSKVHKLFSETRYKKDPLLQEAWHELTAYELELMGKKAQELLVLGLSLQAFKNLNTPEAHEIADKIQAEIDQIYAQIQEELEQKTLELYEKAQARMRNYAWGKAPQRVIRTTAPRHTSSLIPSSKEVKWGALVATFAGVARVFSAITGNTAQQEYTLHYTNAIPNTSAQRSSHVYELSQNQIKELGLPTGTQQALKPRSAYAEAKTSLEQKTQPKNSKSVETLDLSKAVREIQDPQRLGEILIDALRNAGLSQEQIVDLLGSLMTTPALASIVLPKGRLDKKKLALVMGLVAFTALLGACVESDIQTTQTPPVATATETPTTLDLRQLPPGHYNGTEYGLTYSFEFNKIPRGGSLYATLRQMAWQYWHKIQEEGRGLYQGERKITPVSLQDFELNYLPVTPWFYATIGHQGDIIYSIYLDNPLQENGTYFPEAAIAFLDKFANIKNWPGDPVVLGHSEDRDPLASKIFELNPNGYQISIFDIPVNSYTGRYVMPYLDGAIPLHPDQAVEQNKKQFDPRDYKFIGGTITDTEGTPIHFIARTKKGGDGSWEFWDPIQNTWINGSIIKIDIDNGMPLYKALLKQYDLIDIPDQDWNKLHLSVSNNK